MLIEIKPNNESREPIVTSAFVNKVRAGGLVVIDTKKRGCYISASFSQLGGGQLRSVGYHISEDGYGVDADEYDVVILKAEDKAEEALLDGLPYSLTNKDQIEIIIVPWAKLKTLKYLCSTYDK